MKCRKFLNYVKIFFISYLLLNFNINVYARSLQGSNVGELSDANKIECVKIELLHKPFKTEYSIGSSFRTEGIEVQAEFKDGSKRILDESEYDIKIGKDILINGSEIKDKYVGNTLVNIGIKKNSGIKGNVHASFYINVDTAEILRLSIEREPLKKDYLTEEELDTSGLLVTAEYSDENGEIKKEILNKDEYKIIGFEKRQPSKHKVIIIYKNNENIKAYFDVSVHSRDTEGYFADDGLYYKIENINANVQNKNDSKLNAEINLISQDISKSQIYAAKLEASCKGIISIKQNDKIIFKDLKLKKGINEFEIDLKRNEINQLEFLFTPDDTENLNSYKNMLLRFNIEHKLS